ncbi:MAG: hypothetical protein M0R03_21405 [Novosphingobium sp.]|jgi:hypothetical protein|nr:hypothetical protein [Novosphingobium sp.]
MKYRIVKYDNGNEAYYMIQEKFLWFWIKTAFSMGCESICYMFDSEKDAIDYLTKHTINKKSIVKEFVL